MNVFWRTYYHLVWATKDRLPLITPDRELILFPYIRGKADALGCMVQAIDGVQDHIHLVVSIPPTLSITDFVKNIKGSSAYHLNHQPANPETFAWQRGYGVFTLSRKQLDQTIDYVNHQKEHHHDRTTITALEHITDPKTP
jgi:putative transposase